MSMRAIYRKIGKKHGVSPLEIKRDMQAAIDYAFQKPDKSDKEKNIQRSMPHKGAVPTTDEFVQYLGYKIKRK